MKGNASHGAMTAVIAALVSLCMIVVMQSTPGPASQGNAFLPTTGTYNGLQAANYVNDALDAVLTCNKGGSAPVNALGGAAKAGQCWLDDSNASLLIKKRYTGAAWVVEGVIDVTNGVWVPPVGGGVGSVNAAATTDLCASPQAFQTVNSTGTISSFGANCTIGTRRMLVFSGVVTISYNATSMILPGRLDFTTEAGDVAEAVSLGSGNWRLTITKINGNAVANPAVEVGSVIWSLRADVPAKYALAYGQALSRASYPDYLAAVTRVQNATRSSGNATLTAVSDTSKFGVGMPIEGTGISPGTTIVSVTSSTIVMSANASTSGTSQVTVFLTGYGQSGSSSTVGVPDCRGRVLAGRDNMGGTAASRLTSSYFGANASALNVAGGAESQTLSTAQIPSHTHANALNDPGHFHVDNANPFKTGSYAIGGGGPPAGYSNSNGGQLSWNTASAFTNMTITNAAEGGGGAHPIVPPTLTAECFIRVLAMNEPGNDDVPVSAAIPFALSRRFV